MKTVISLILIITFSLAHVCRLTGQTFTTMHNFTGSDGALPIGGLITNASGDTLYGTATQGGSSGNGTVFAVNTDGTGFTNLHSFAAGAYNSVGTFTNREGANPNAGLILSGNALYGTTYYGGSSGYGTVFVLNTNGTGFANLHSFTGGDGAYPAGLVLSGNSLYGTALQGGSSSNGTVFAVDTNGTGFTNLHSFTADPDYTNSDGAYPRAGLILSGNTLYGTANPGGSSGWGTVFSVNTDGTGFTTLHSFTAPSGPSSTNSDGAVPNGGLILSGNTLYGTANQGGSRVGTVFAVNTNGTGFITLHSFAALDPIAGITNSDGAYPGGGLILTGNTLYGMAQSGGSFGDGTVFSLSFRPQLTIVLSGTNVILSWPVSFAGFSYGGYYLQETSNLLSPEGWAVADSFPPIVVNGQYKVTRPMLGPQISYRLKQL